MNCPACAITFSEAKVKSLKYWDVYVHPNQTYLGRGLFVLKRHAAFKELSAEEKSELARAEDAFLALVNRDFKPETVEQYDYPLHAQHEIVPRYKSFRIINGAEFTDEHFGKPADLAHEWNVEGSAKSFLIRMLVMRFRQTFLNV
ncbi:hypothetical protein HY492_03950 [Candidatus Woesearchaeota archaeon]|nr:hypothetical protein [Candidatus Woesearchaeota archaeon]